MSRIVSPGSFQPDHNRNFRHRTSFVVTILRQYGWRGLMALLQAALFAFAPLLFLIGSRFVGFQPIRVVEQGQKFVVKPAQKHDEQEREEPGETALLQVRCDVPDSDGWQELLTDGDPAKPVSPFNGWLYVRDELVYLRKSGSDSIPFVNIGPPPASIWVPAGEYEVLVVYRAPTGESRIDLPGKSFPWLSESTRCSLESGRKTVCRVQLPHHDRGNPDVLLETGEVDQASVRPPTEAELLPLLANYSSELPIPVPSGYLLTLQEPQVLHQPAHRHCTQDYNDLNSVRREWTRTQLVDLRHWLSRNQLLSPAADAKLTRLIDRLGWREFLVNSWAAYIAAGISGLVLTRWGTLFILEPSRHRTLWQRTKVMALIFVTAVICWSVVQLMID